MPRLAEKASPVQALLPAAYMDSCQVFLRNFDLIIAIASIDNVTETSKWRCLRSRLADQSEKLPLSKLFALTVPN